MTQIPPKYIGLQINDAYVEFLESKIKKIARTVDLAQQWCDDQENGMTDGQICMAAMKDIRRFVKEFDR